MKPIASASRNTRWSARERETGVPAAVIRETAHAYARAERAQICWTLGITEHHNAVDNVLALINLGLLTGHVGRYGSGLNPLRGQNNVQGGGDMGAIPDRLPGFQHVENDELRAKFERAWGVRIAPKRGWHLSAMFEAMERGELTTLYVLGENPADSEADRHRALKLLSGLEFLVVQDLFYTNTADMADVVLPAAAGWCETEGTVTKSERRVQRVRRAVPPPAGVRDDIEIIYELARRLGHDWGEPDAECIWDEVRRPQPDARRHELSPSGRAGRYPMALLRRIASGRDVSCTAGCGRRRSSVRARRSARSSSSRPSTTLDDDYPIRLTTGRRLDSYNYRRADRALTAPRYAAPRRSTSRPKMARATGSAKARRCASARAAARSSRRSASIPGCVRASRFSRCISTIRWRPTSSPLTQSTPNPARRNSRRPPSVSKSIQEN